MIIGSEKEDCRLRQILFFIFVYILFILLSVV